MQRRQLLKALPAWPLHPSARPTLAAWAAAPALLACQAPPPALRVGAIAFAGYAFLFLAERLGALDPARVRLMEMRSSTDSMRALATRRVEAAALTLDEVVSAVHEGVPLKVVAVLDSSQGADAVMARPGLTQPAQARGRRIGVESTATGALVFAAFLQKAGLGPADVTRVPVTLANAAEAYGAGRIDLAVTAEPWVTALEAQGARRLFDSSEMPGRIVDVLAVRSDALARHARQLPLLLAAHFGARASYEARPQPLAPALAPWLRLPPERVPSAFRGLHFPTPAQNRLLLRPGGELSVHLARLAVLMQELQLVRGPVDTSALLDDHWLRELPPLPVLQAPQPAATPGTTP